MGNWLLLSVLRLAASKPYQRAAVVARSEAGLPQSTIGVRHDATRTCAKEGVAIRAHRRRGCCSDRCVLAGEDAAELAVARDAAHTYVQPSSSATAPRW